MRANPDGTLDITVEEVIKMSVIGFAIVVEDGHVVAVVEDK